ncbi:AAA family ATPase, partial [Corallococcus terminator]
ARATLPALLGTLRELEASSDAGAVRLSPLALETLLDLQQRFVAHEAFPGKAVRLLRRVVSRSGTEENGVRRFTQEDVTAAMREQTGLPDFVLGSEPPKTRDTLERELAAQVAGQPEAVTAVVDAILTLQRSLQPPDKPLATYLFVGPTGVGKTETAKALARTLFGSEGRLVRFDMSEFVSASSITRLLGMPGAPDGELTTALRTQPFCVVLFDEVEKAHPRIFDALLQFLGEGRLTDGAGRTVDARQAVVVLTSNLGVREAAARTGFHRTAESAEAHYLSSVRAFFRPEFFNRLDRVVPFRPLTPAALRVVVEHALESLLSRRGIRRGNVLVEVEPALLDLLVEQAYDPRYGARPLKRALERRLTVPLAHHLVQRGAEDLARVELFPRGDDMGLCVELLSREKAWAPQPDPAAWTLADVSRVLEETAARLEALGAPQVGPEALELVERLERLRAEAVDIRETELAERDFLETEEAVPKEVERAYDWRRNPGRGGLRARPSYASVPLPVSREERLRRCRPRVVDLWDEVEWLSHQLACRERGPDTRTLLIEGLGDASVSALESVVRTLPQALGRVSVYEERVEPDGRIAWTTTSGEQRPAAVRVRRMAVSLTAFGLAEVLAPLEGYALVESRRGDGMRRSHVRLESLDGVAGRMDDVSRAVAARDAVRATEREARRMGTAREQDRGRAVLEGRTGGLMHLASQRSPFEALGWAGCVLRHAARKEG